MKSSIRFNESLSPNFCVGYSMVFLSNTFTRERYMNIYVGNLSYNVNTDDLKGLFGAHGAVTEVNLMIDKYTGQSKGFAFIEMPKQAEAEAAIKALNENPLKGRNLKVNQARPRDAKPARRPRY
jgi:RNA recognition motif-containing protein